MNHLRRVEREKARVTEYTETGGDMGGTLKIVLVKISWDENLHGGHRGNGTGRGPVGTSHAPLFQLQDAIQPSDRVSRPSGAPKDGQD